MLNPTSEMQRFAILDVLRGLALMGIALANFPEFALFPIKRSTLQREKQGLFGGGY